MKLPLIAACVVAGSTWSFASTNVASNTNPKTAQKSYHASGKSVIGSQSASTKTAGSFAPIMGDEPSADEMAQYTLRASRRAAQLAASGSGSTLPGGGGGAPNPR